MRSSTRTTPIRLASAAAVAALTFAGAACSSDEVDDGPTDTVMDDTVDSVMEPVDSVMDGTMDTTMTEDGSMEEDG